MFMLLLSMKTRLLFVPVPWTYHFNKKCEKQQQAPAVSVNDCYSKTLKLEIYRMKLSQIKAVSLNLLAESLSASCVSQWKLWKECLYILTKLAADWKSSSSYQSKKVFCKQNTKSFLVTDMINCWRVDFSRTRLVVKPWSYCFWNCEHKM